MACRRAAAWYRRSRATLQAASATDVTEQLPGVAARALVLHRRETTQIPVEVSQSLARDLPRGRLVILDGSQPTLFMEDQDVVVSMLADFFCAGIEPPEAVAGIARGAVGHPAAGRPASLPDGLSRRELEVLRPLAAGESNRLIARRLDLSPHTVERHVANRYRKIGARGRPDATAYALRNDLA